MAVRLLTGLLVLVLGRWRSAGNVRISAFVLPLLRRLVDSLLQFLAASLEVVGFLLELVRQAIWVGLGHACGLPEGDGAHTRARLSAGL